MTATVFDDAGKRQLIEQGYVVARAAVPTAIVHEARRAINAHLGEHGMDPDKLTQFRAQSYCPDLKSDPAITDLFNAGSVAPLAESLLGEGNVRPPGGGQIALRFPKRDGKRKPTGGHIDGIHSPTNGVPKGTLAHFTMLVGVLLSDLPDEWAGNFTVFPGSHRKLGTYFREHDPADMIDGRLPVKFDNPRQITGKAGDVVFAHYLLGHGVTPNLSPDVRYAIFFRVLHQRHEPRQYRPEAIRDMWLDWDGLHGLLDRAAAAVS